MNDNDARVVITLITVIGLVVLSAIAGLTIEAMTDVDMETTRTLIKTAVK